jgi:hypothetical protein
MSKVDLSEFYSAKKCAIGSLPLSEEQWAKINTVLKMPNKEVQTATIMEVLDKWGFPVKRTTLSEHRRGLCCCGK